MSTVELYKHEYTRGPRKGQSVYASLATGQKLGLHLISGPTQNDQPRVGVRMVSAKEKEQVSG